MLLSLWAYAAPAAAQVPDLAPLNHDVRYDVSWNGIGIGRIIVNVHEDTFSYRMHVDTKTKGIARMFSKEKTQVNVEGRRAEGEYKATRYQSDAKESGSHTLITYDETGAIATRDRKPKDDPSWRAEVPLVEANRAIDPVTAFFVLRKEIHANMKRNVRDTQVRTYEGARLAVMNVRVVSPARIQSQGKYHQAINTVITRQPIMGYTPKEIKKFKEGDPTIHIYFSADERFIPLKAEIALRFGTLTAVLSEIK